ncbi:unnamed protein product [Closterium sp. Yama58-4]|nr:unnamed protein product [Closterium sp. Yama58-4]
MAQEGQINKPALGLHALSSSPQRLSHFRLQQGGRQAPPTDAGPPLPTSQLFPVMFRFVMNRDRQQHQQQQQQQQQEHVAARLPRNGQGDVAVNCSSPHHAPYSPRTNAQQQPSSANGSRPLQQPLAEPSQRGYATGGGEYGRDSHHSPQRNQSSHQPSSQPSHKNRSPIARSRHDASRFPDDAQPSALPDLADPDSAPAGRPLPFFFPMRPSARASSPPDGQERGRGGREGERMGMLDMSLGLTSSPSRSLLRLPSASASASAAAAAAAGGAGSGSHAAAHDATVGSPRSYAATHGAAGGTADGGAAGGAVEKADLRLEEFMVQHDMENCYMWAFRVRPHNALGKMQLRSYMNGHSRFGEPQFPFSAEKGFVRSHRMQRKRYKGLSNPQCIHGVQFLRTPDLSCVPPHERQRWIDLTGREWGFVLTNEADEFSDWRISSLSQDTTTATAAASSGAAGTAAASGAAATTSAVSAPEQEDSQSHQSLSEGGGGAKGREEMEVEVSKEGSPQEQSEEQIVQPPYWLSECYGVLTQVSGPVTCAKTLYEDATSFLILVSLPFADLSKLRVTWRNSLSHGIVKVQCASSMRQPTLIRWNRAFHLTDAHPEHCPPGEFVREIVLPSRIPDSADVKAFFSDSGGGVEILVPKLVPVSQYHEREVRVFLPPKTAS